MTSAPCTDEPSEEREMRPPASKSHLALTISFMIIIFWVAIGKALLRFFAPLSFYLKGHLTESGIPPSRRELAWRKGSLSSPTTSQREIYCYSTSSYHAWNPAGKPLTNCSYRPNQPIPNPKTTAMEWYVQRSINPAETEKGLNDRIMPGVAISALVWHQVYENDSFQRPHIRKGVSFVSVACIVKSALKQGSKEISCWKRRGSSRKCKLSQYVAKSMSV